MHSLTIDNLTKTFASQTILKNISLNVEAGEFLILVGPSGCGKSTLLNAIAGLDQPSSGTISIQGKDITNLSPGKRDIAMVFQSYALYPNMNVGENISFGLEMQGASKKERELKLAEVAKTLQIEHLLDRKPAQLSGGQRQRVAMGRALAREPQVFLFDEPLSNLDAKLRVDMRLEMKRLHKRLGTTIVYVTHDQVEAMTLGDRIAVMKDGKVQQLASPQEIYDRPENIFVAGFMGSPTINFIKGQVEDDNGNCFFKLASDSSETVRFPLAPECKQFVGKSLTLGIRPEQITEPLASSSQNTNLHCKLDAAVEIMEPTGPDTLVTVRLAGSKVSCRVSPDWAMKHQETIPLMIDLSRVILFDEDTGLRCFPEN